MINNNIGFTGFEVGKRYSEFQSNIDVPQFEINDTGANIRVFFRNPTDTEIKNFKSGSNFEIRYITLKGVIYILFKLGSQNWMDAPYTPHLSLGFSKKIEFNEESDTEGLGLTVMLIDSSTGEVKTIRFIGLGNRFSKGLAKEVEILREQSFDRQIYDLSIADTYSRYPTTALVKMSSMYYKLR